MSSTPTAVITKEETERRKRAFALWEDRVQTLKESAQPKTESAQPKSPAPTQQEEKKTG